MGTIKTTTSTITITRTTFTLARTVPKGSTFIWEPSMTKIVRIRPIPTVFKRKITEMVFPISMNPFCTAMNAYLVCRWAMMATTMTMTTETRPMNCAKNPLKKPSSAMPIMGIPVAATFWNTHCRVWMDADASSPRKTATTTKTVVLTRAAAPTMT